MRVKALLIGIALIFLPSLAKAQQQTCEQRATLLAQLLDDVSRTRGTVSTAEIEAANLKITVRALQAEVAQAKKVAEKQPEVKAAETPETK